MIDQDALLAAQAALDGAGQAIRAAQLLLGALESAEPGSESAEDPHAGHSTRMSTQQGHKVRFCDDCETADILD